VLRRFLRRGPAVATLSIFVEPLTREFGWSLAALSGRSRSAAYWRHWHRR
jgi:hypothetical protein